MESPRLPPPICMSAANWAAKNAFEMVALISAIESASRFDVSNKNYVSKAIVSSDLIARSCVHT